VNEVHHLIKSFLKENKENLGMEISTPDLVDLINIYKVSCDILDPIEMPTITGYKWEESQDLLLKLKEALKG
jgi:hypothetical protein